MVFYEPIDWDEDKSLSVVPISCNSRRVRQPRQRSYSSSTHSPSTSTLQTLHSTGHSSSAHSHSHSCSTRSNSHFSAIAQSHSSSGQSRSPSSAHSAQSQGPLIRPSRYIELVEGLGVFLPAHEVLGAVTDSKTASSLMRKLMSHLFSTEEMATSSVREKTKKALDKQKMEAIIGFAINKYPAATSEYLINQANDKLHAERKKFSLL
ncbi:hypothetical protein GBAR_LOCUS23497 [Geodia barretti]|uniref:BEN domain-containing protein n=1 Tax=Geodia barretti TaxID=519541 RepID=A0AA35T6P4_GEOBA|nr:hypothetical protein GBAR_LOCUS23497 [Geodia barretti]